MTPSYEVKENLEFIGNFLKNFIFSIEKKKYLKKKFEINFIWIEPYLEVFPPKCKE